MDYFPPGDGALLQGEILGSVWEHQAAYPATSTHPRQRISVVSTFHSFMVVLSPACDLEWDYEARFGSGSDDDGDSKGQHRNTVTRVLMCDLQMRDEIRPRFEGQSELWRRVEGNQDERYHQLSGAPVGPNGQLFLHNLFIDFKKVSAVETSSLYSGLMLGEIGRVARVPDVFLHDVVQRFYGFLSRVGLPD